MQSSRKHIRKTCGEIIIQIDSQISTSNNVLEPLPDIVRGNKYPLGALSQSKIHKGVQADFPANCILNINIKWGKLSDFFYRIWMRKQTYFPANIIQIPDNYLYLALWRLPSENLPWTHQIHPSLGKGLPSFHEELVQSIMSRKSALRLIKHERLSIT